MDDLYPQSPTPIQVIVANRQHLIVICFLMPGEIRVSEDRFRIKGPKHSSEGSFGKDSFGASLSGLKIRLPVDLPAEKWAGRLECLIFNVFPGNQKG